MGPSIGSVRRSIVSLGGCDDDQVLLRFNREYSAVTAAVVTPTDLAAELPKRGVTALAGVAVEGPVFDANTRPIRAPAPSVKEGLRKRGETGLLEIVSSASPHLDAALDHLVEVL